MATTQFNKEYLQYTKEEAKKWHLYIGGPSEIQYYKGFNPDPNEPKGSCCIPGGPYNLPPMKGDQGLVYCLDNVSEIDCRTLAGGCPQNGPYCPPGPEGYCYRFFWKENSTCSLLNPPCSSIPKRSHEDPQPGFPEGCSGPFEKPVSDFNWGEDVIFLYRIKENDVNFVTDRIDWERRITSAPWKSNGTNLNNKVVFNPQNNISYVCVSDNPDNRSDLSIRGKNLSFNLPNHTVGEKTYDDGYTWYALFSVDPGNINLITRDAVPVPSIDDFSPKPTNTTLDYSFTETCGASYKTTVGTCCLYNKFRFLDPAGITQNRGELSPYKIISKCYECIDIADKLGYEYQFVAGVTAINLYPACTPCDCTYSVKTQIEKIEEKQKDLNPAGSYKFLYDSYKYWEENKQGIISVFIDLENLTEDDKTVDTENPIVTFKTISGSGAEAQLQTVPKTDGKYLVTGIKLISNGKSYEEGDAKPIITDHDDSPLNDKIEVNITPKDFPEVPHVMLNNMKTNIKINIDNGTIKDSAGSKITQFSKYGIIKNVKLADDEIDATDALNKNETQVLRTTTILTLTPSGSDNKVSENPDLQFVPGESIKLSENDNKRAQVGYFKYNVNSSSEVTSAQMEVITKDYDNIQVGDTIKVNDNFEYVVSSINKPDVFFGSGTPLMRKDTSLVFPQVDIAEYLPKKAVTFNIKKS